MAPPPSEGGGATITAMSALAAVRQYLSTKSAKSTFLRHTELVVKAISSKRPHDQDMQAQNNVSMVICFGYKFSPNMMSIQRGI